MHFQVFFSAPSDPGPPHYRYITNALRHTTIIWTSDMADAETSTGQDATLIRDKYTNPRGVSKPQSQQASLRRPTP